MIKNDILEGKNLPEQVTGEIPKYKFTSMYTNPSYYAGNSGNGFPNLRVITNFDLGPEKPILSELTDYFFVYSLKHSICSREHADADIR